MIALYIIIGIILLFIILLCGKIRINIAYDGDWHTVARYLFIKINVMKIIKKSEEKALKSEKKAKKNAKKDKKKKEKSEKDKDKDKNKKNVGWETIKDLLNSAKEPTKILIKKTSVSDLDVKIIVSGEDAAQTAIKYGNICITVHTAIAALRNYVKVNIKNMNLGCDFLNNKTTYDIKFNIKIRVFTIIILTISFIKNTVKTGIRS